MVGSKGNPHPNYDELLPLVARGKLNPGRLVTRQIELGGRDGHAAADDAI